jgi:protease YdgD
MAAPSGSWCSDNSTFSMSLATPPPRYDWAMPFLRRFPPPWSVEQTHPRFTVRDENGQALRGHASFGCGAILASVLILATPVLAVDSEPHREIVDVQRFPWSSIGKVSSAGEHCTGTVIGADRFLTAAHCLYLTRTGHFLLPASINILLGYEKGEYRVHRVASRYTIPPAFDPSLYAYPPKRTNYLIGARNDWAIVYTDESFPLDIKPLRLASTKPSPGTAVKMAGYPAESLYAMTADPHCQITEISHDEKLIAQNCITHSGDSGGPLLSADDDGLILGVQVLGYSLFVQLREQSKEGGVAVSASSITEFLNPKAGEQ